MSRGKWGLEYDVLNSDLTTRFRMPSIGKTLRIISPFTYCDDGEHVGAFIREVNGRYLVSDRCDALMNMEARGDLAYQKTT